MLRLKTTVAREAAILDLGHVHTHHASCVLANAVRVCHLIHLETLAAVRLAMEMVWFGGAFAAVFYGNSKDEDVLLCILESGSMLRRQTVVAGKSSHDPWRLALAFVPVPYLPN